MLTFTKVFFLFIIYFCNGISTIDQQCSPDIIDFATKIEKSSVVVYGKAMAKILNEENNSLFHIFFQVDCILKGPEISRQINITNAGHAIGREYCQEFLVGHGYSLAFLEPISLNTNDYKTFTPADFSEIQFQEGSTDQLLAQTCNLDLKVPFRSSASVSESCPPIGTDPICDEPEIRINAMITDDNSNTISDYPANEAKDIKKNETLFIENGNEILLKPIQAGQQEIIIIGGGSNTNQIDVDQRNNAKTITYSVLLLIIAIFTGSNSV